MIFNPLAALDSDEDQEEPRASMMDGSTRPSTMGMMLLPELSDHESDESDEEPHSLVPSKGGGDGGVGGGTTETQKLMLKVEQLMDQLDRNKFKLLNQKETIEQLEDTLEDREEQLKAALVNLEERNQLVWDLQQELRQLRTRRQVADVSVRKSVREMKEQFQAQIRINTPTLERRPSRSPQMAEELRKREEAKPEQDLEQKPTLKKMLSCSGLDAAVKADGSDVEFDREEADARVTQLRQQFDQETASIRTEYEAKRNEDLQRHKRDTDQLLAQVEALTDQVADLTAWNFKTAFAVPKQAPKLPRPQTAPSRTEDSSLFSDIAGDPKFIDQESALESITCASVSTTSTATNLSASSTTLATKLNSQSAHDSVTLSAASSNVSGVLHSADTPLTISVASKAATSVANPMTNLSSSTFHSVSTSSTTPSISSTFSTTSSTSSTFSTSSTSSTSLVSSVSTSSVSTPSVTSTSTTTASPPSKTLASPMESSVGTVPAPTVAQSTAYSKLPLGTSTGTSTPILQTPTSPASVANVSSSPVPLLALSPLGPAARRPSIDRPAMPSKLPPVLPRSLSSSNLYSHEALNRLPSVISAASNSATLKDIAPPPPPPPGTPPPIKEDVPPPPPPLDDPQTMQSNPESIAVKSVPPPPPATEAASTYTSPLSGPSPRPVKKLIERPPMPTKQAPRAANREPSKNRITNLIAMRATLEKQKSLLSVLLQEAMARQALHLPARETMILDKEVQRLNEKITGITKSQKELEQKIDELMEVKPPDPEQELKDFEELVAMTRTRQRTRVKRTSDVFQASHLNSSLALTWACAACGLFNVQSQSACMSCGGLQALPSSRANSGLDFIGE